MYDYNDDCFYDDLDNFELDRLAEDRWLEQDDERFIPDDEEYNDNDDVVCVSCDYD